LKKSVRFIVTEIVRALGFEIASALTALAPVPVPAVGWLFGSALGLLGWVRRKAAG